MSLLDRGPHSAMVQRMRPVENPRYGGNDKVPDGPPVLAEGLMIQPLTTGEATDLGLRPDTSFKVIGRTWPGGLYSEATWNGRKLYQRGETRVHSIGRRTQHCSAILVANHAEVK